MEWRGSGTGCVLVMCTGLVVEGEEAVVAVVVELMSLVSGTGMEADHGVLVVVFGGNSGDTCLKGERE